MAPQPAQLSSRSPMRAVTMASLTSSPASMIAFTLPPIGEPLARASRSMSPVDSWILPRFATSRAACVPFPASGGPNRMMFCIAALSPVSPFGLAPPRRGLELRLFDQVAILVGDQVALNLADRVHRHVDDDQQAGPAETQVGEAGLGRNQIGNQADQYKIGRADHGDAVEQIIEIGLGRLAWTDPGDEAAVAL